MECRGEKNAYWALVGKSEERDHLHDTCVDGKITLKMDLKEIMLDASKWINLAQVRDKWRAVVNKVINLPNASNVTKFFSI